MTFTKQTPSPRAAAYEYAGLEALRDAGARVPQVYSCEGATLTIERIDSGGPGVTRHDEEEFGRELAALHATTRTRDEGWGGVDDDPRAFLGLCPVHLPVVDSWEESYLETRVRPLARRAVEEGCLDAEALRLVDRLEARHLGPDEPPTLVHGDLWAGNRMHDYQGRSWLIDPAAQWGHRELDLAMMHLFGGFTEREIGSYDEALPLAEGWRDRIPLYQLLPLLVHAILFGGGYGAQTLHALRSVV